MKEKAEKDMEKEITEKPSVFKGQLSLKRWQHDKDLSQFLTKPTDLNNEE